MAALNSKRRNSPGPRLDKRLRPTLWPESWALGSKPMNAMNASALRNGTRSNVLVSAIPPSGPMPTMVCKRCCASTWCGEQAAIAAMAASILAIKASSLSNTALSSVVKPPRLFIVSLSVLLRRTILARRRISRSSLRWLAVGGFEADGAAGGERFQPSQQRRTLIGHTADRKALRGARHNDRVFGNIHTDVQNGLHDSSLQQ